MKKKILFGMVAVMIAAFSGVKVYDQMANAGVSGLMLENVEALSCTESNTPHAYRYASDCPRCGEDVGRCFPSSDDHVSGCTISVHCGTCCK